MKALLIAKIQYAGIWLNKQEMTSWRDLRLCCYTSSRFIYDKDPWRGKKQANICQRSLQLSLP